VALSGRPDQASRSSRLTKVAALAVFAAIAALSAEGAWLVSHHDAAQSGPAPAAPTVSAVPAPIAPAGTQECRPTRANSISFFDRPIAINKDADISTRRDNLHGHARIGFRTGP
jgi:hypothetical protein